MTDVSVEDYLEHFGVKGMRWGVRRERTSGFSDKVTKEDANRARNKKIAATVGVGLVVGAVLLAGANKRKRSSLGSTKSGQEAAKRIVSSMGKTPTSSIKTPSAKPKISKETSDLIRRISDSHNEQLRLANVDLKAGYERNQVPLNLREYIPQWA
jgi:hypothetical protein